MSEYLSHRFRSADGRLDLFARDYRPDDRADGGVGEGLPLLLMHGLTRNSADFEPLVPHLSGRRLIVPDQRGRGLSDYDDDPALYRLDIYVADMFALMDGLGIDRFGIVGTSMGGLMGMVMAAFQPARIAALALNDIGPVVDDEGMERIRGYVGPRKEPAKSWEEMAERFKAVNAQAFLDFGQDDWLAFARRTSRQDGDLVVTAFDPAISQGISAENDAVVPDNLWPVWDAVSTVPALVIRGAVSDLLSAETVSEMARRHEAAFASTEVPLRGHAPLLDEPAALAALLPFLQVHS